MTKDPKLRAAKTAMQANLLHIKTRLSACVEQGMMDEDAHYYNEILDLMDDVEILKTWEELTQAVVVAKGLETEIDAWLAMKGQSSLSMEWPEQPD